MPRLNPHSLRLPRIVNIKQTVASGSQSVKLIIDLPSTPR
jgi:hypothetical protein